jgi:UDP-N-acetylmuramoyl-tripeptide--D-alanyl-D-alanine ligase
MRLTLREASELLEPEHLIEAVGPPQGDAVYTSVSTDTRTLKPGDLFVALVSEKADGHDFAARAVAAGAAGIVASREVVGTASVPIIHVTDTVEAYGLLARHHRDGFDIPVVGVTGSVGKTTTKEMLAVALSPLGPVLKTEASQNNETGVPKTLLQLTDSHAAAVIEMGMRGTGQIADLCLVARPTIGVITVIAETHIELLGSKDAIADAKGELPEALPPDGVAVLNADDPYLDRLRAKTKARVVTYGTGDSADLRATDIAADNGGWGCRLNGVSIRIPSASRHDLGNAAAAVAAAVAAGVCLEDAAAALAAYRPPPMRMEPIACAGWGGTVLNDAYNAAPPSMRSALATLSEFGSGRKIAFLGDMRELGDFAEQAHREIGDVIAELGGLDALYTAGDLARYIPGAARRFADSAEAARFAETELDLKAGDVVLVKGSRAMTMEKIAQALAKRGADAV